MRKNITIFLLTILFFFCIPLIIKADYKAYIHGSDVNIRNGAGTGNKVLYTVNANTEINVVDKTLISGEGCTNGWYKIIYKDNVGYVCSKYVTFDSNNFEGIVTYNYTARVSGNNTSVRKSASSSATTLDTLSLGVNVSILDEVSGTTNSGCSSKKWYKIQYYGNKTGYICKDYVYRIEDVTAYDEDYTEVLRQKGFPDTYIPYLTHLHNKYPNWVFEPVTVKGNAKFLTVVDGQEGKNLMQTTNDSYRTSSKPAEGSSWYKVNSSVIAFYLDPRNWLTENEIFMFEDLKYDSNLESLYPTLVKNIFGSGKLGADKYTIPMYDSGKSLKVSPLSIATRIKQEVGVNGSASTSGESFTWKGKTYSGYYNFFNIGAYEATIDGEKVSAVKRGLLYAAKLINRSGSLWNNPTTAITEGSSTLASGYINNGQETLYYQKFNVSPTSPNSMSTHQYMTNIQAPASESKSVYNTYKSSNILDNAFVFKIPVYNQMPEYTSLPNVGDNNNELSALSIEGYSISPKFDKDILTYDVYIPKSINKININATAKSTLSTINGNGEIEVKEDETDITITVTSQTGLVRKYVVSIHKVDDNVTINDVLGKTSYMDSGEYLSKIKPNIAISKITEELLLSGANKVVITDKNDKAVSSSAYMATGYKITISTLLETKAYKISVTGDTSGDGKVTILDLLQIQKHIKKLTTLKDEYLLAADTSGDSKVTILDLLQVQKHIKKIKYL